MTPSYTPPQQVIIQQQSSVHWLIRAVYFLAFGLWASGVWAVIAWVLCVTVIGLPLGLWMLNRLPQIATLKPASQQLVIGANGQLQALRPQQLPFLIRAIYFVLIGWWFSAIWIAVAWALHATIIGIILGFWMLNRVPAVITLARS